MLTHHYQFEPETTAFLRKAHLQPQPRIAEGQLLVRRGVRATIDISDGLVADLGHLCKASEVGAILKAGQVPIHPRVKAAFPKESLDFALSGGEDYELLFAVHPSKKHLLEKRYPSTFPPLRRIGALTAGTGVRWRPVPGAQARLLAAKGYDHFRR